MALPIRDGNSSLTTLSTIVVSSAHIPAHTVVSLGSQAITDIAQAVSGVELGPNTINALENISVTFGAGASITVGNTISVTGGLTNSELRASSVTIGGSVQVSNFPATQVVTGTIELGPNSLTALENITVTLGQVTITGGLTNAELRASPVTIGGSVSATISGTPSVTFSQASVTFGTVTGSVSVLNFPSTQTVAGAVAVAGLNFDGDGNLVVTLQPGVSPYTQPISGTVTANGRSDIYDGVNDVYWNKSVVAWGNPFLGEPNLVDQSMPLPISGTVTATIRNGEDAILNDAPSGYTVIRALSHWSDDVSNEIKTTSQNNPLPITGTVTANLGLYPNAQDFVEGFDENVAQNAIAVHIKDVSNNILGDVPFPISGTVTANLGNTEQEWNNIGAYFAQGFTGYSNVPVAFVNADNFVRLNDSDGNSIVFNNGNLPISGTVTANGGDFTHLDEDGFDGSSKVLLAAGRDQTNELIKAIPLTSGGAAVFAEVSGTVTVGNLPDATNPKTWQTIGDELGSGLNAAGLTIDVATIPAISGTVTAMGYSDNNLSFYPIPLVPFDESANSGHAVVVRVLDAAGINLDLQNGVPVLGTVTVGNSVTIGSLPAISGTVTANVLDISSEIGISAQPNNGVQIGWYDNATLDYKAVTDVTPFPISGTVTVSNVAGFSIPTHDFKSFAYTSGNLTQIAYKTGGASGTTVGILTLAYDGSGNLTSMTRT